jgi:O-acetyl-ADP-ribose deacetylase (regulator of RNase III)
MITWKKGDLFLSDCSVLGAPVNAVGTMGAGLAKEFARRFQGLEPAYKKACKEGSLSIGTPWLWHCDETQQNVLCIATKDHWKLPSEYLYVEQAMEWIALNYARVGIADLALPMLGCGLGGLEWSRVKQTIERYLGHIDLPVEVYES